MVVSIDSPLFLLLPGAYHGSGWRVSFTFNDPADILLPFLSKASDADSGGLDKKREAVQYVVMRHVVHATPLSEPVYLTLVSLSEQPRHGYSLLKDIEAISQGRVRLSTGTLYGALRRLLEQDWIERIETDDTSREKQTYRLTSLGQAVLEQEYTRLKQLTRIGAARLRTKEA
jgi:DNA-binding PadR family transcriptional regulator